jgi:hypothetical protein
MIILDGNEHAGRLLSNERMQGKGDGQFVYLEKNART